ncbi:eukaryotic translation initiation factor 4 gamma 3-like [Ciona intestinalis]
MHGPQSEDDPLVRSENAWKPSKLEPKATDLSEDEQQTAEILRKVRGILNKMMPQNFRPLLQKVLELEINTEARLRGVVDLIFEKAIDEASFCEPYANMCCMMSQFRVSSAPGSGLNTFEFRKFLLTRCQREFEKDRTNEEEALNALKVKIENAEKPEVKQQLNDELELETMKQRRRMLGNIRFIGELFKLNMLTESIMHNCIMSLFQDRNEDSLECLCRLLNTIGKGLDNVKGKTRMDQYFEQMNKIVREQKTTSRVRFMLMDIIDLRLNNWVQGAIKSQAAAAAAKAPTMNQVRCAYDARSLLRTRDLGQSWPVTHTLGGGGAWFV